MPQSAADSVNPYQPPATVSALGVVVCTFQVGNDEINTVTVESSLWKGLQTYATDAAGVCGEVHRGPCRFEVGERERHQVRIEVDDVAIVNAYVDDELIAADLLARRKAVVFRSVAILLVLILIMVLVIILLFEHYKIDEKLDTRRCKLVGASLHYNAARAIFPAIRIRAVDQDFLNRVGRAAQLSLNTEPST